MRSVIWIGLILALVLGLLLSAISCNTVYIPATPTPTPRLTPKPTPTPIPALTPTPTYGNRPVGEGIAQFLNDNHINSVLWEEWNIFDEYIYALSIYEGSSNNGANVEAWIDFYNNWQLLVARTEKNYQDFIGITPPTVLENQWGKYIEALSLFYQGGKCNNPYCEFLKEQAINKHAQAWLELRRVCNQYGVSMEWPLPRSL